MNKIFDTLLKDKQLRPVTRFVGIFILAMINENKKIDLTIIAKEIGCGKSLVANAIHELELNDYLTRNLLRNKGKIVGCKYEIHIPNT